MDTLDTWDEYTERIKQVEELWAESDEQRWPGFEKYQRETLNKDLHNCVTELRKFDDCLKGIFQCCQAGIQTTKDIAARFKAFIEQGRLPRDELVQADRQLAQISIDSTRQKQFLYNTFRLLENFGKTNRNLKLRQAGNLDRCQGALQKKHAVALADFCKWKDDNETATNTLLEGGRALLWNASSFHFFEAAKTGIRSGLEAKKKYDMRKSLQEDVDGTAALLVKKSEEREKVEQASLRVNELVCSLMNITEDFGKTFGTVVHDAEKMQLAYARTVQAVCVQKRFPTAAEVQDLQTRVVNYQELAGQFLENAGKISKRFHGKKRNF